MRYTGERLQEIVFPLGGIGTGSLGLAGNGALTDWEIFNRPNKGSINPYSFFAVKATFPDGRAVARVLMGDVTKDLSGTYSKTQYAGFGYGPNTGSMAGFPHFRRVRFDGKFPLATLTFEDENFPAVVKLRAFNPFIPLNADDSSLPAAFFEIGIRSREEGIVYTALLSVSNPFSASRNRAVAIPGATAVRLADAAHGPDEAEYGDLTIAVAHEGGVCQENWYRGSWQDRVTTFWRELEEGELPCRHYDEPGAGDVATVGATETVAAGENAAFRFLIAWNKPNQYNYWSPMKDETGRDVLWKNYYATRFEDSAATVRYALAEWRRLERETTAFARSLHASTLDPSVIDAASASLTVLKSPTVLRLEDGTFYGWEGVHETAGSCEGTCTHVWSYAYALCFLFPTLERSLRDTEFRYDTDRNGRMRFRTLLPLGRTGGDPRPCLDGQMATVIKIYRDWKLTGDSEWLRDNWENVKRILEFAWSPENDHAWDRDRDGVLEGRQHHTLDVEAFGPSSWLEGMYLAALKAASLMAEALGDGEKAGEYRALFEKGYVWTKENLFNGAYFIQRIDVRDRSPLERFCCPEYWNEEKEQIKYQIADGSALDQMLGQWHADITGLGDVFDPEQRRIALQSMMKNNFKPTLRETANMWRVFALNDEGGALICDYPAGCEKPAIPIPYCEECMTGFEYAFAGLLIAEGFIDEGLRVVRAVRGRYDGKKRNPYNEIECGSNYARSMASFALLPICSGFSFDLPSGMIGFAPVTDGDFRCFWSVGSGWGDFLRRGAVDEIAVRSGRLTLASLKLRGRGKLLSVEIDGRPVAFRQKGERIEWPQTTARRSIRLIFAD